ncbi:uncharacterized protein K02A2.6-like [Ornithodoros turicata]|uniref:uncharacterized protein K02A2.6-like n=1 Tax=Ornithodoros turicata TaxID=34597 RepID=UPI003139057A
MQKRNYAQVEREALAIVYEIQKFHKYLYGRTLEIITDHQPLTQIFSQQRHTSPVAVARVQRWINVLAAYSFTVKYRKGDDLGNADGLSRVPLQRTVAVHKEATNYVSPLKDFPLTAKEVERETTKDNMLRKVREFTQQGWPKKWNRKRLPEEFQPFEVRKEDLSVDCGCLLWNGRIVVPGALQNQVKDLLHEDHIGFSRIKMLARTLVWWPKIDRDLEDITRNCSVCQSMQNVQPAAPLQPWAYPARKWERVHMDFAEAEGSHLLIIVDAHSKWVEVGVMPSTNAARTIEKCVPLLCDTDCR